MMAIFLACSVIATGADGSLDRAVRIGSKTFTESVVLGDVITLLARDSGTDAVHRRQLGGTRVVWNGLCRGDIDVYPEYTGTIAHEILSGQGLVAEDDIRAACVKHGLRMSRPLGFNNTYALGMRKEVASRRGIRSISDLRDQPDLRIGFTNEFLHRADGWPSLREKYGLPHQNVTGLEHDLAYRGLAEGTIDVTDVYTTDADITYYGLRVLRDDLGHFPRYDAVLLYRDDLATRFPAVEEALLTLQGRIDEDAMRAMNARAKLDRVPEARVAADFLENSLGRQVDVHVHGRFARILGRTWEHLVLVGISLAAAMAAAIPLGVAAAKLPRLGHVILGLAGVLQTVPSLALLVFMIPVLGIGGPPAVAALFVYSLLPIVRNTHAGLVGIPVEIRESAEALGLPSVARLWRIEMPMASPAILAGIKTSAVINVGTATLGALIGAGGYGQPIMKGIRLDDMGLILEGALPAAALAIVAQGLFEGLHRIVVPKGLRLSRAR